MPIVKILIYFFLFVFYIIFFYILFFFSLIYISIYKYFYIFIIKLFLKIIHALTLTTNFAKCVKNVRNETSSVCTTVPESPPKLPI